MRKGSLSDNDIPAERTFRLEHSMAMLLSSGKFLIVTLRYVTYKDLMTSPHTLREENVCSK